MRFQLRKMFYINKPVGIDVSLFMCFKYFAVGRIIQVSGNWKLKAMVDGTT